MDKFKSVFSWIFASKIRIIGLILIILISGVFIYKSTNNQGSKINYQTAKAEKGTLVTSISASGQVTNANNVSVTIQSSGVVKEVLVKNGDRVSQGQTLATLTLDQASQQKAAAAYASYLSAKNSLDVANAKYYSLQNALFVANQKFINDAVERGLETNDPTYIEENASWLQAEADYKNQATVVSAAQSSLAAASLNLSQISSTITAPVAGIVKGLTITPGSIITVTSSSTNSTSASQVLGSIYQEGPVQAQVNLSEIDAPKVLEGQKVTMTLDAFPDSTFTGKVVSIDTNGVASSGVTTYPAVVSFDSGNDHIYPNMAVNTTIITKVENDVLIVPSAAVQTVNGTSTVMVFRSGQVTSVPVEIGDSNDTQIVVTSGLNAGDEVVTNAITTRQDSSGQTTSPFGGGRSFGGGAVFRTGGGGR